MFLTIGLAAGIVTLFIAVTGQRVNEDHNSVVPTTEDGDPVFRKDGRCLDEGRVDFSRLRRLSTNLSKRDLVTIYRKILDTRAIYEKVYLNALALPFSDRFRARLVSPDYPALPSDLTSYIHGCYVFALFDDVYVNGTLLGGVHYFVSVTSPRIFSNGTVVVKADFLLPGSQMSSYEGFEYRFIRDHTGTLIEFDSRLKYRGH